jgi:hypothetical protein
MAHYLYSATGRPPVRRRRRLITSPECVRQSRRDTATIAAALARRHGCNVACPSGGGGGVGPRFDLGRFRPSAVAGATHQTTTMGSIIGDDAPGRTAETHTSGRLVVLLRSQFSARTSAGRLETCGRPRPDPADQEPQEGCRPLEPAESRANSGHRLRSPAARLDIVAGVRASHSGSGIKVAPFALIQSTRLRTGRGVLISAAGRLPPASSSSSARLVERRRERKAQWRVWRRCWPAPLTAR